MGGSAPPSAPKAPPAPTQTRRQAQFELDQQLRDGGGAGSSFRPGAPGFSPGSLVSAVAGDPQARLDARPESDFLAAVDDRDFQSLDAQIRGASESATNTNRNRDTMRSLLELIGEDVNSPTIL